MDAAEAARLRLLLRDAMPTRREVEAEGAALVEERRAHAAREIVAHVRAIYRAAHAAALRNEEAPPLQEIDREAAAYLSRVWREILMGDDPVAEMKRFLGTPRRGPKRKDEQALAVAIAVQELVADGKPHHEAVASVADAEGRSPERDKQMHHEHRRQAKADVAMRRTPFVAED